MSLPQLPAFAEVVDQSPDGFILIDGVGVIVYANPRVAHLFGVPTEQLLGQPVEVLIPDRLRGSHARQRSAYSQAPRIRPMGDGRLALQGRRADGTEFPVEIHLAPINGDHGEWVLAVVRDATERHLFQTELQDARQLAEHVARLKGEFLALAAHDLGQPQQILELLVSEISKNSPSGSVMGELAGQAMSSLERMRELLKMLMEISSLESGRLQVVAQHVSVPELFAALQRQFQPVAQAKALRFDCDPCQHVVDTDPALLRGMLSNLVANAIRYTPHGEVSVRCVASADGTLQMVVADTGIGIPDEQLPRIFEDFYRLTDAPRTPHDGFGLGLGIVRRLSALLEFPVTVQSCVGKGSIFKVQIPAQRVSRAA